MSKTQDRSTDQANSTEEITDADLVEFSVAILQDAQDAYASDPELRYDKNMYSMEIEDVLVNIEDLKDIVCIVFEFGNDYIDIEVSSYNSNLVVTEDIDRFVEMRDNIEFKETPNDLRRQLKQNKTNIDKALKNVGHRVIEHVG